MHDADPTERTRRKFEALAAVLDERSRRQWAASEAQELGYGGISAAAKATGLARDTIRLGMQELHYRQEHPDEPVSPRLRQAGAGRKPLTASDPGLLPAL